MSQDSDLILISELLLCCKEIGSIHTAEILRKEREKLKDKKRSKFNSGNLETYANVVLTIVSRYKTVEEIVDTNDKSSNRKLSLAFFVYFLHNYFNYSFSEIKLLIKFSKSYIFELNKLILSGNKNIQEQKIKYQKEIAQFKK